MWTACPAQVLNDRVAWLWSIFTQMLVARYVTTKDVDVPARDNPKACAVDAANTTLHTSCTNLTPKRVLTSHLDLT